MQRYVVGFAFSMDRQRVLLIKKNRPDWQKGKLNGIGGKIEDNEDAYDAMEREFFEEAGVHTFDKWLPLIYLADYDKKGEVNFFYTFMDISKCMTMTDELVVPVHVIGLCQLPIVDDLNWLIPMALYVSRYNIKY